MKSDEFNLFISLDCQPTLKFIDKMDNILEKILTKFALEENISKPSFIILYNGKAILEELFERNSSKLENNIYSFVFKYGNTIIDLNKKFDEIANNTDKRLG